MILEFVIAASLFVPFGLISIHDLRGAKKKAAVVAEPYSREARKTLTLLEAVIRNDPAAWSCSIAIPGMDFTAIIKHKQSGTSIVFYNERMVISVMSEDSVEITPSMVSDYTYQSFFNTVVGIINTQGKAQIINDFNKIVAQIFSGEPGSMFLESRPEAPKPPKTQTKRHY